MQWLYARISDGPLYSSASRMASKVCCGFAPNIIRGLEVDVLIEKANDHGLLGDSYDSVHEALKAARKCASKSDFIFVGGSNFTVAEVV